MAQSRLSEAMEQNISYTQGVDKIYSELVKTVESRTLLEKVNNDLEDINKELLSKTQEMGSNTEFRKALILVQNLFNWTNKQMKKEIPLPEKEDKVSVQPKQLIR